MNPSMIRMKMQRILRMTPTRRKPTIRVPLPDLCSSPKPVSYTHLKLYIYTREKNTGFDRRFLMKRVGDVWMIDAVHELSLIHI